MGDLERLIDGGLVHVRAEHLLLEHVSIQHDLLFRPVDETRGHFMLYESSKEPVCSVLDRGKDYHCEIVYVEADMAFECDGSNVTLDRRASGSQKRLSGPRHSAKTQ